MASRKTLLYYGALLHDVGKVLHRVGDAQMPSAQLGAEFIARELADAHGCGDLGALRSIADQVRYHSASELEAAALEADSLAYVTCFANSVSAGADDDDEAAESQSGAPDRSARLSKIFNRLNGHDDANVIEHEGYASIRDALRNELLHVGVSAQGVSSLLGALETTLGAVPASLGSEGLRDVSLYDHAKTTAGIASCVYEYLNDHGVCDYREALFGDGETWDPHAAPMFLLYSCDMSGIQDFIYNISGDGALRQLRARSMYLELLLEHIVDELLARLSLSRANLLYTGGGHAYLLLPNTEETKGKLRGFSDELTAWFVGQYRNDLYVASAWVPCCADDLANRGEDKGRYPRLHQSLSMKLSEAKAARYDAATIRKLNFSAEAPFDHSRECSECHRSDLHLDDDNKCTLCAALGRISKALVDKDVFVVSRHDANAAADARHGELILPFGCCLSMLSHGSYHPRQGQAVRVYAKNGADAEGCHATRIWMGDYAADTYGEGIAAYARQGTSLAGGRGINRLGVLRADVDDLGATFASGLPDALASISRTSALSRSLSYFFKARVNEVLQRSSYQAQIIYSGGDDLFIVGNWSDVIYAAVDIRRALDEFTGNGSLTISAGVGMFGDTYPIARMAVETGMLEDAAKSYSDVGANATKNAIALWSPDLVFGWDEFIGVVEPRMREIGRLFAENEKGSAFIYRLIGLLRTYDSAASAPRLAYLLARSFEGDREHGNRAGKQFYAWAQDPKERRRLIAALEWHVFSIREGIEQ